MLRSEREHVDDASADGILSSFDHEVLALEAQLLQLLDKGIHVELLSACHTHRTGAERGRCHHLLGQCVGPRHHHTTLACGKVLHRLAAHDDVAVVSLFGVVVVSLAVAGREEQDPCPRCVFTIKQRLKVAGHVVGVLLRGGEEQMCRCGKACGDGSCHNGRHRTQHAAHMQTSTAFRQGFGNTAHKCALGI